MASGRKPLALARAVLFGLVTALSAPALAQEGLAPLLTLDQERFFTESAFGRASIDRERAAAAALAAENTRIEGELVAEEQSLTDLRQSLPAADFAERAAAFDVKVEQIRDAQDAKGVALTANRDADRQAFLQAAVPVLGELLREKRAVAIIDKSLLILSLSAIDVTDEAITRVDALLGGEPAP